MFDFNLRRNKFPVKEPFNTYVDQKEFKDAFIKMIRSIPPQMIYDIKNSHSCKEGYPLVFGSNNLAYTLSYILDADTNNYVGLNLLGRFAHALREWIGASTVLIDIQNKYNSKWYKLKRLQYYITGIPGYGSFIGTHFWMKRRPVGMTDEYYRN